MFMLIVASLQPLPRVKGSGETITIAAGQTLQLQCIVENMPRKLKVSLNILVADFQSKS